MVSIRWTYDLKVDVEESEKNLKVQGFEARCLEGETKNFVQHYPLNQVIINGGNLSPNVSVHVGPNVTQIYYSIESPSTLDTLERMISDVESAERILNCTIVFAPEETARFGKDTSKPVLSTSTLKLQISLKDGFDKILNELERSYMCEIDKIYFDAFQGRPFLAQQRLKALLDNLNRFCAEIIKMARDQGLPETDKWEEMLKRVSSAPLGSLGNIWGKTDLSRLEF